MNTSQFTSPLISVKFGFLSRGVAPYMFHYQNVTLLGKGHYEVIGNNSLLHKGEVNGICRFTSERNPDTYILTLKVDNYAFLSCRYDPEDLKIVYTNNLKCITDTWLSVDH